jgi:hypothetical protein
VVVTSTRLNLGSKIFAGAELRSGFFVEADYQLPMTALTTVSETESVSDSVLATRSGSLTRDVQIGSSSNFNDSLSGFGLRLGYRF